MLDKVALLLCTAAHLNASIVDRYMIHGEIGKRGKFTHDRYVRFTMRSGTSSKLVSGTDVANFLYSKVAIVIDHAVSIADPA